MSGIIILITLVLALELSQRKQGSPQIQTARLAAQLREAITEAQAEVVRLEAELKRKAESAHEVGGVSESDVRHDLFVTNEQIKSLEAELTALRKQHSAVTEEDEKLQAKRFDREKERKKLDDEELKVKGLEEKLRQVRQKGRLIYNPRTADGKQVWLVQIEGDRTLVAQVGSTSRPQILSQGTHLFGESDFEKWLANRSASADFVFLLVRPESSVEFNELKTLLNKQGFSIGFDLLGPRQSAIDLEKGASGP